MPNRCVRLVRTALVLIILLAAALAACGCACCGGSKATSAAEEPAPTPEETTLTAVGQEAPGFTLAALDGGTFSLADQRGKIVLINWFATWCPPCKEEMPHLQVELWERFAGDDFVMVSVAREEKADEVAPYVAKHKLAWPFLLDPERTAYARYAEAYIPRNHVVGRDGSIIFQSEGFEQMIAVIAAELQRGP